MYKKLAASVLLIGLCQTAFADDLFVVTATVNSNTQSFGFSNVSDAIDKMQVAGLQNTSLNYTPTSVASFTLNYRGLPMTLSYGDASAKLVFDVASIGMQPVSFVGTGATAADARDNANQQFKDFLKTNGGDIVNRIMKKLAEVSPVDPIAGNPNSLQSQMVTTDFDRNFTSFASNIKAPQSGASTNNLVGLGLRFGSYDMNGKTSDSYTIPLSYTNRSDLDPRRQLTISAPITYTTVEGGKVYGFNPGISYRVPMNDEWALTPAVGYGLTGSADLGSLGQMVSASLTSSYVINRDGYDVAIGNMVGFYQTMKAKAGDYSYDPGIKNTIFRNGVMLSQPTNVFGKGMSIEYSLVDTRFTGDALYTKGYDEIGVTIGTNKGASSARSYLRAGLSYLTSAQAKGFTANIGYWF